MVTVQPVKAIGVPHLRRPFFNQATFVEYAFGSAVDLNA